MAIQSMTGFGKYEVENENFTLSVEIKSVNNRYKDIRFKMSPIFNSQEINLRAMLESTFGRGSFEISAYYKKKATSKKVLDLDETKIRLFIEQIQEITSNTGISLNVSPTDFLRSDFYTEEDGKEDELNELLRVSFQGALNAIAASRLSEGTKLLAVLRQHQGAFKKEYLSLFPYKDLYQDQVRERLNARLQKEKIDSVDEGRFLQEVVYYLEKLDVDEELNRIQCHLEKMDQIFEEEAQVGRQLDFLIQELNRETNTIGSKSGSSEISQIVVQMKVHLEKIREQALNLE